MKYYLVIGINDKGQECLYNGTDSFVSKTIYERASSRFNHIVLKSAEIGEFVIECKRDTPKTKQYVTCDYCNKKLYRGVDSAYIVNLGDDEYYSVTCDECKKNIKLTFITDENAFYWTNENDLYDYEDKQG